MFSKKWLKNAITNERHEFDEMKLIYDVVFGFVKQEKMKDKNQHQETFSMLTKQTKDLSKGSEPGVEPKMIV